MDNRNNQILFSPTQKASPAVADLSSFYQVYYDKNIDNSAGAGDNNLTLDLTPAGIIRVVTSINAMNISSNIDQIYLTASISSVVLIFKSVINVSVNQGVDFFGHVFLDNNDYIRATFSGCSSGDNIKLWALGYNIKKY